MGATDFAAAATRDCAIDGPPPSDARDVNGAPLAFRLRPRAIGSQFAAAAIAALLGACGGSGGSSGSNNTVVASLSPSTSVRAYVGKTSAVTVTFTTSDGAAATALTLALSNLPGGWTASQSAFKCADVAAGGGCALHLEYAPVAVEQGKLQLSFSYTAGNGGQKTGTVNVPYTATQPSLLLLAGSIGGAGDLDGPAASARFKSPNGVAVDASGTIYVLDAGNARVRTISPDGFVSTFAQIYPGMAWLALAPGGMVYVADNLNIYAITASGTMSRLWSGFDPLAATYHSPLVNWILGLAADAAGNLYIANGVRYQNPSPYEYTIVKLQPDGTAVSLGQLGATGLSATVPNGILYFISGGVYTLAPDGTVNKVPLQTPANATDACGSFPAIAVDANQNVYADCYNLPSNIHFVVEYVAATQTNYVLPSGQSAFAANLSLGLALQPNGNLVIADPAVNAIMGISAAGVVATIAGQVAAHGAADGPGASATFHMTLGADFAWACPPFTCPSSYSTAPGGIAADAFGNLYVADSGNGLIRKVAADGNVTTVSIGAITNMSQADCCSGYGPEFGGLNGGLSIDSSGDIYATISLGNIQEMVHPSAILKIAPTEAASLVADPAGKPILGHGYSGYNGYFGEIATRADGSLVVLDTSRVIEISPAGALTVLAGTASSGNKDGTGAQASFGALQGMALASSGDIYVSDGSNQTIRRITSTGVVTTVAGTARLAGFADGPAKQARFSGPASLAFDESGILYIADIGNSLIRRLLPDGTVDSLVGTPGSFGTVLGVLPGSIDAPQGLAIRSDQQLAMTVDSAVLVTAGL